MDDQLFPACCSCISLRTTSTRAKWICFFLRSFDLAFIDLFGLLCLIAHHNIIFSHLELILFYRVVQFHIPIQPIFRFNIVSCYRKQRFIISKSQGRVVWHHVSWHLSFILTMIRMWGGRLLSFSLLGKGPRAFVASFVSNCWNKTKNAITYH